MFGKNQSTDIPIIASTSPPLAQPKHESLPEKQRAAQLVDDGKIGEQVVRIALHPLGYEHLRDHREDGKQRSQFITAQLLLAFSKSTEFELLDRSIVSALFSEKTNLLVGDRSDNQEFFRKLPISNYTVVGELLENNLGHFFSLKLVKNSTGEILGAAMSDYSFDDVDQSMDEALAFIDALVRKQKSVKSEAVKLSRRKLAISHFVNIDNGNKSQAHQGRAITEHLINEFADRQGHTLLARTQVFPLVFEEYLRELQYTDDQANSERQAADFLIHGKFRINNNKPKSKLSIYLYVEQLGYTRELIILHANSWRSAIEKTKNKIEYHLLKPKILVSKDAIAESHRYFLEALKQRGLVRGTAILRGDRQPSRYDLLRFISVKKPENRLLAKSLIEKSLKLNPENHLAQLSNAIYQSADREKMKPDEVFKRVMRTGEKEIADLALALLKYYNQKLLKVGYQAVLSDVTGPKEAKRIYDVLVEQNYLIENQNFPTEFNRRRKAREVFDFSHLLKLPDVDFDTSIKVFESLRALHRIPGTRVGSYGYLAFPRSAVTIGRKNNVAQYKLFRLPYNAESVLHGNLGDINSGSYVNTTNDGLTTIDTFNEALNQPTEIRQSNLEIATDQYAASVFIDKSYLQSKILLGHSLCDPFVAKCHSASMIFSWVVDQTQGPLLDSGIGVFRNVTDENEELDRLIYFAAAAVNRVEDAKFSDYFQYTLDDSNESIKQKLMKLDDLLANEKGNGSPSDVEDMILVIGELLKEYCGKFKRDRRLLRVREMPIDTMDTLTSIASKGKQAANIRKRLLADIEGKYPTIYPYLLISAGSSSSQIVDEQDEMIRRVVDGEIKPEKTDRFMNDFALPLFHRRIAEGKRDSAESYIKGFVKYYGLSQDTAINFAYMHHKMGDIDEAQKILRQHSRDSILVADSSFPTLNGTFNQSGFNSSGQLKFSSKVSKTQIFSYDASRPNRAFKESNSYWRLLLLKEKKYLYAKTKKNDRAGRIHFGNHIATISWISFGNDTVRNDKSNKIDSKFESIELTRIEKSDFVSSENSIEHQFYKNYVFSPSNDTSIKGYPSKATAGPLKDQYFPSYFTRSRRLGAVRDTLFRQGLVSVSGVPIFENVSQLRKQLIVAFPSYPERDRDGIEDALVTASRLNNAGYAEILQFSKTGSIEKSILVPDDPILHRRFGVAFATSGDKALVCDRKNKIYSFKKTKNVWEIQNTLNHTCIETLAMSSDWAGIQSKNRVIILKSTNVGWQTSQILNLSDLKTRTGNDIDIGAAIAFFKNTLYIGNPSGGLDESGEVYIYKLHEGAWYYNSTLKQDDVRYFGASIKVNDDILAIGAPYSDRGGSVFIYENDKSNWRFASILSPASTKPRTVFFGVKLALISEPNPRLLIRSSLELFEYTPESKYIDKQ